MKEGAPTQGGGKEKKAPTQWRDVLKVEDKPKGYHTKHALMGLAGLIAASVGAKAGIDKAVDVITGNNDDGLMRTLASYPPENIQQADADDAQKASGGGQQ
jgi:hypothetical protein